MKEWKECMSKSRLAERTSHRRMDRAELTHTHTHTQRERERERERQRKLAKDYRWNEMKKTESDATMDGRERRSDFSSATALHF